MKNKLILTMLTFTILLSGCSAGSSTTSSSWSTGSINSNPSNWVSVGEKSANHFTSMVYDAKTDNLYAMKIDGSICSISANASTSDQWNCNILLPDGYRPSTSLTIDESGNLYTLARKDTSFNYILSYNTSSKVWNNAISTNNQFINDYITYYNGNLLGNAFNKLVSVNATTGAESTINNFFSTGGVDLLGNIAVDTYGNAYYPSGSTFSIYFRDLNASSAAKQMGASLKTLNPATLTVAGNNLYFCSSGLVDNLPLGSNSTVNWKNISLPLMSECQLLTYGNGYLYSYITQSTGKFGLFKYNLQ